MGIINLKIRAFSIIELIVVVTILAILAALAIPAYNKYTVISKLGKAKTYIDATVNALRTRYDTTGTFAGSLTIGGTTQATYTNGSTYAVTGAGPIVTADYRDPTLANTFCKAKTSASFAVWITGLEGMSGYTAPSPGGVSNLSGIYVRAYVDPNGVMRVVCGKHFSAHAASMDIDYARYLGCDQTEMSTYACP